jgi:hypothetical protein
MDWNLGGKIMKRTIALILACLMLLGQAALCETGASIGSDRRLVVPGGEAAGIGENVESIVVQTDDAV